MRGAAAVHMASMDLDTVFDRNVPASVIGAPQLLPSVGWDPREVRG